MNNASRPTDDQMTSDELSDWFDEKEATRWKRGCAVALVLLLAALGMVLDMQDKAQGVF